MYIWNLQEKEISLVNIPDGIQTELKEQSFLFNGFVWGICTEGSMQLKINFRKYRLEAHQLFTVLPEHILTILDYTPNFKLKIVLVSPDYLYKLPIIPDLDALKGAENSPCLNLNKEKQEEIVNLYEMAQRYGTIKDNGSEQIKMSLILSLSLIILSLFKNYNSGNEKLILTRQEKLTNRFFELMWQYHRTERRVRFYADKLCVTPKYLSANIKTVTRHTVQEWLIEITIADAKRTLRTTDWSIQQISETFHFLTASSFVRFFRKHTGYTPLEYRRQ